ncbi:MAG: aryl-sulfate sulfotransferase [Chitinophagales bacterium]|nr:aryl-sulfate sulfotransferase [Chitinophagales bacterium]
MTAYNTSASFDIYNSNYVKVRSVSAVNGYLTDVHELQLFPNGHYFLIADEFQVMDLTQFDPSYNSNATVTGNVIQEFDGNDNLLFEWRTFDHIIVSEAPHENFTNGYVDAVHMNALEQDNDGNLLVSCRHLDQVFKLNLNNGHFIWRHGGDSNQFVFTNDPAKFNYQHDIRRLANGDVTLFDNNDWGNPNTSYAKEYQLDEVKLKATLVWSYTHPAINGKPLASSAMGSVQRFDNGNTLGDWGIPPYSGEFPNMTEIDPSFNIVWELKYQNNEYIYRAHRYTWDPCSRPTDSKLTTTDITATSATLNWNASTGAVKYYVEYRKKGAANWKNVKVSSPATTYTLTNLLSDKKYEWRIQTWCNKKGTKTSGLTATKTFTTAAARMQDLSANTIESFILFPNPGTDAVTAHWTQTNSADQVSAIQILNYMGQVVMEKNIISNEGNNEWTLPTSSITKGLYFIRITIGATQITSKWVKE